MMILRSSVFTGLNGDTLNADALRGGGTPPQFV